MEILAYFLIPLASAAIGWFTNYLAIKMLFHPREPRSILGLRVQGVFPKRQIQFAEQLGDLVSDKLLSFDDIKDTLVSKEHLSGLQPLIEEKMDYLLRNKLKDTMPMIGMFVGDKTIDRLKKTFGKEIIEQLPDLIDRYLEQVEDRLDIRKLVRDKVAEFEVLELEALLKSVLGREFRFIEMLGAVIGFLIGMVQLLFMLYVIPALS